MASASAGQSTVDSTGEKIGTTPQVALRLVFVVFPQEHKTL